MAEQTRTLTVPPLLLRPVAEAARRELESDARQQDVEVELDAAMIDALEADFDLWEWLAEQERTKTAEGRRRAAAKAKTIERFLASVTPPELVRRTEAEAKDGDA